MEREELLKKILECTEKETKLDDLCEKVGLTKYEVLGLIGELKKQGNNILEQQKDDGIYLFNQGEKENEENNQISFQTDENNEFKFVAISDLRFGSKSQQLSILNDIYQKAYDQGYRNVIICGNITEGLYPITSKYADSNFLDDSLRQVDFITNNFPKIEGMKTYFITGKKDESHMKKNKINIGKRISEARDDMIYLGDGSCLANIDKASMLIFNPTLAKTYTVSYRPQQQIDSFRSEDKPDILLIGGLLQMEKFNYRNVNCISVPSTCATTEEMEDKRQSNTIGAWYVDVKTDSKGKLEKIEALDSVYYVTRKNDYQSAKVLNIINGSKKQEKISETKNDEQQLVNKISKYIKNGMPIEEFMANFHIEFKELSGIIELCKLYGKEIEIVPGDDGKTFCFKKVPSKKVLSNISKVDPSELNEAEILVVSDTHLGNIHQQLHLLNLVYDEAHKRGITTVLHCGDVVDGNYTNRPEQPRQQFLHGFDEQVSYVVDMYPKIYGMNTYYILGSHDESHYKNGQATLNEWVSRCRPDMKYLGQDFGTTEINGVKVLMDHPGGGSAKSLSYKPQQRIEGFESGNKPKILLVGHYHKSYSFVYRNVRGILVPSFCDTTQFQHKQGLSNAVGAYFLHIYSDAKGNIQYFEPEEILFDRQDMWDEAGKDSKKVKKLVIEK